MLELAPQSRFQKLASRGGQAGYKKVFYFLATNPLIRNSSHICDCSSVPHPGSCRFLFSERCVPQGFFFTLSDQALPVTRQGASFMWPPELHFIK
jgi:hypothetical protein